MCWGGGAGPARQVKRLSRAEHFSSTGSTAVCLESEWGSVSWMCSRDRGNKGFRDKTAVDVRGLAGQRCLWDQGRVVSVRSRPIWNHAGLGRIGRAGRHVRRPWLVVRGAASRTTTLEGAVEAEAETCEERAHSRPSTLDTVPLGGAASYCGLCFPMCALVGARRKSVTARRYTGSNPATPPRQSTVRSLIQLYRLLHAMTGKVGLGEPCLPAWPASGGLIKPGNNRELASS